MARKPPKGKSLAEVKPELAKQRHTSKTGDLTTSDVMISSRHPEFIAVSPIFYIHCCTLALFFIF